MLSQETYLNDETAPKKKIKRKQQDENIEKTNENEEKN